MNCFLCKESMQEHQIGSVISGYLPNSNQLYTESICKTCLAEAYPWEVCSGCNKCLTEQEEEDAIKVLRHKYMDENSGEEVTVYWYYCPPCAQEYNIDSR